MTGDKTPTDMLQASGLLNLGKDPPLEALGSALENLRDLATGLGP